MTALLGEKKGPRPAYKETGRGEAGVPYSGTSQAMARPLARAIEALRRVTGRGKSPMLHVAPTGQAEIHGPPPCNSRLPVRGGSGGGRETLPLPPTSPDSSPDEASLSRELCAHRTYGAAWACDPRRQTTRQSDSRPGASSMGLHSWIQPVG